MQINQMDKNLIKFQNYVIDTAAIKIGYQVMKAAIIQVLVQVLASSLLVSSFMPDNQNKFI